MEPGGKTQQSSPAAVSRGQLAGAEQRVAETLGCHPRHHQPAQYEADQHQVQQSALPGSGGPGCGKIISSKALAIITAGGRVCS